MKCKKHPKYKGIHKPKVECEDCEKIYEDNHSSYDDGYDTYGGGPAPLD